MPIYQALIHYRDEKPYGVGATAHERHTHIVPGYRGEIVSGLDDGRMVYTGVCDTRDEVKAELISHLKRLGLTGALRVI